VTLRTPVPIYVVYITAWVTPEGEPHFARDSYGRDEGLGAGTSVSETAGYE
jgi:murein L,D-transpeptidase YcbB/YkuD